MSQVARPLYALKNMERKGKLEKQLREYRTRHKMSYRQIATHLSESGASVGRTAVEDWCKELGIN